MSTDENTQAPVEDWATDYDIFADEYIADPFSIWDDLRDKCPIAKTERWGGSWLPTKYADIQAMAKIVPEFSSHDPLVTRPPTEQDPDHFAKYGINAPPISADPPEHTWTRRLLLPYFSPGSVKSHFEFTTNLCHSLIDGFIETGEADGAVGYAQQIPPRVIAHLVGVDESRTDDFIEWVRGVLELGLSQPELRIKYREKIHGFFWEQLADRKANPGDDFISVMLRTEVEGKPIEDQVIVGMCNLLLVAGIDTTWSSIGSALWHLATHPEDRQRLVDDPSLLPAAIEEFLRAYSPVTMARLVTEEVEYGGCTFKPDDKVLMNFPGANRDPEMFPEADEVIIDRVPNRHVAFGSGIHRCAGSNLARMEMNVAIGTWLERIPDFELAEPDKVTWAGGQVRGPRQMKIKFPPQPAS